MRAAVILMGGLLLAGCSEEPLREIVCWGGREEASATPPQGLKVKQYSVGGTLSCGIDGNDKLVCWGKPNGADDRHYAALSKAPTGAIARFVSVGDTNGCIINENNQPQCWGNRELGEITPASGVKYTKLHVSYTTVCAITEDGKVECWGDLVKGAVWPDILKDRRVKEFKFGRDMACWITADDNAFQCTGWFVGDEEGYTYQSDNVTDYGMEYLGNRFWLLREYVVSIIKDGKATSFIPNLSGFARDMDACMLYPSGGIECQRMGGAIDFPFGPSVNVPEGVRFESIQMNQPMACGLKK